MIITNIEVLRQKKNRIWLDGEYAFMLYDKDMAVYKLEEGSVISDILYDRILKETVIRRARQKAVALLERADRSEAEIKKRLKLDLYSEPVANDTIVWLKGLHYLDDDRFAQNYIRSRITSSSRQELLMKLLSKGISRESFEDAYEECCSELKISETHSVEGDSAVRTLRKKLGGKKSLTSKEKMSAIGYMLRKGFRRNDITAAFDELEITVDPQDIPEE